MNFVVGVIVVAAIGFFIIAWRRKQRSSAGHISESETQGRGLGSEAAAAFDDIALEFIGVNDTSRSAGQISIVPTKAVGSTNRDHDEPFIDGHRRIDN